MNGAGIFKTDKVIFLYMPWEIAEQQRVTQGRDGDGHESNKEHLIRAEETYLQLSEKGGRWERINCATGRTIETRRLPEDIGEEVYDIAMRTIR